MPAKKVRRFKNTKKVLSAKKSRIIIEKSSLPVSEEASPIIIPQPELVVESVPDQEIIQPSVENVVEIGQSPPEEIKSGPKETDFLYPKQESTNYIDESTVTKKSDSSGRVLLLFLFFILGFVAGGILMYFYKANGPVTDSIKNQPMVKQPTPTLVPTEIPVDLKQYSISILNGSLVKGGAAKLKAELETEGFSVSTTGNATSSAFKETIIRAKKSVVLPYLEKLKTSLSKEFVLGPIETLPDSQKTDVVITIGSKTP